MTDTIKTDLWCPAHTSGGEYVGGKDPFTGLAKGFSYTQHYTVTTIDLQVPDKFWGTTEVEIRCPTCGTPIQLRVLSQGAGAHRAIAFSVALLAFGILTVPVILHQPPGAMKIWGAIAAFLSVIIGGTFMVFSIQSLNGRHPWLVSWDVTIRAIAGVPVSRFATTQEMVSWHQLKSTQYVSHRPSP